ncbi:hypothetical protein [Stenomitos frigidus]|uniref:hypothetical protein n=1 Tax=Stenomitos frigidus TaxID=1886765 RepID=UPI001C62B2EC|nr:hypothetical protein [Stenomitos frigidus]
MEILTGRLSSHILETTVFKLDEVYPVKAGDFIGYRAGGEPHKLRNNGNTLLKCIVVGQRLEHDVGDYPNLKKRIYRNKGLKWNLVDLETIDEPIAGKKT